MMTRTTYVIESRLFPGPVEVTIDTDLSSGMDLAYALIAATGATVIEKDRYLKSIDDMESSASAELIARWRNILTKDEAIEKVRAAFNP